METIIENPSMLRVGTILRGVYRIDSYLASGGFGKTYVATNIEFNERVAIKEFFIKDIAMRDSNTSTISVTNSENLELFAEQKEKFKKEARRMRQLNNPYIVRVHDLFEENGTAYYVMDYIDGENLSKRLERIGRPMPEAEVLRILPQILDALQTVHEANIWHLDLKPSNIMLDKSGNVKLIDFGASKQLNAQKGGATTGTRISYTPGYAPREQMEQNYDKFGPWTDIYALGATLYNLLTNKRPPLPTDIDDDMSEEKSKALSFPLHVSHEMKVLILWLMKTNRFQRPQNVNAIKIRINNLSDKKDFSRIHGISNSQSPLLPPIPVQEQTRIDISSKKEGKTEITSLEVNNNVQEKQALSLGKNQSVPYKSSRNPKSPIRDSNNKKSFNQALFIIVTTILFSSVAILLLNPILINSIFPSENDVINNVTTVERAKFESALGTCQYSGPVDENNQPHGVGEAFFYDGRYYKGSFIHGVLSGDNAYFKYENGDVFKGEFRDNTFYKGTYTIAADGSYFVGYYKNGQPDGGTWYDKNGNVIN